MTLLQTELKGKEHSMEGLIVIGVIIVATIVAGGVLFRSMRAQGGCSCGGSCSTHSDRKSGKQE